MGFQIRRLESRSAAIPAARADLAGRYISPSGEGYEDREKMTHKFDGSKVSGSRFSHCPIGLEFPVRTYQGEILFNRESRVFGAAAC